MFSLNLTSNSWGKEVYQSECNYLLVYDGDFDDLVASSCWEKYSYTICVWEIPGAREQQRQYKSKQARWKMIEACAFL